MMLCIGRQLLDLLSIDLAVSIGIGLLYSLPRLPPCEPRAYAVESMFQLIFVDRAVTVCVEPHDPCPELIDGHLPLRQHRATPHNCHPSSPNSSSNYKNAKAKLLQLLQFFQNLLTAICFYCLNKDKEYAKESLPPPYGMHFLLGSFMDTTPIFLISIYEYIFIFETL